MTWIMEAICVAHKGQIHTFLKLLYVIWSSVGLLGTLKQLFTIQSIDLLQSYGDCNISSVGYCRGTAFFKAKGISI